MRKSGEFPIVKFSYTLSACLLAGSFLLAQGQSATPTKVATINIQAAIVNTAEGQKAANELQQKFDPKRRELEKLQSEIAALRDTLNKGSNTMSEEAKQSLIRQIDDKTKTFNRTSEDAQAEFDAEQNRLVQNLGQKVMAVIDKYARDNGYALVLDVSNPQTPVLFAANSIDITKDIIDLYDKANAPAAAAPAAGASAKPAASPASAKPATPTAKPAASTKP